MAKRGKNYTGSFRSSKSFQKTYKTYVKKYFAKARQIRKKLSIGITRGRGRVSNAELKGYMYDNELLNKREFAKEYIKVKNQLIDKDSSADPTQYIVSKQAYRYSEDQYRAFMKAARLSEDLAEFRGMSREEFRSSIIRTEEYKQTLSDIYHNLKDEYRKRGWLEDQILKQAAADMRHYFGSK